eukprot:gene15484-32724_t
MRGHLGGFEGRLGTSAGGEDVQLGRKRGQQIVFDRKHRGILRAGPHPARRAGARRTCPAPRPSQSHVAR